MLLWVLFLYLLASGSAFRFGGNDSWWNRRDLAAGGSEVAVDMQLLDIVNKADGGSTSTSSDVGASSSAQSNDDDTNDDGDDDDGDDDDDDDGEDEPQIINSNLIYEWTPIISKMTPGKVDNYMFNINPESTGLGFAPSYEILIFLSGNICQQPTNSTDLQIRVYYSFDEKMLSNISLGNFETFSNGYLEALQISPVNHTSNGTTLNSKNLYVSVRLWDLINDKEVDKDDPNIKNLTSTEWDYRLSISENDLVFQWDTRSWIDVLDTDSTSALISTGNVTDDGQIYSNYTIYDPTLYDLYLYTYDEYQKFLNVSELSLCAIKNGPHLVSSEGASATNPPLEMLQETGLKIQKRIAESSSGIAEQFYITGLTPNTTYAAFLTKKIGKGQSLSNVGGVLFDAEIFTTQTSDACSLIFGMSFCSDNAYSVPSSEFTNGNKSDLAIEYDNIASALYSNFSKALQLVPCDADLDARYSPIRTCDDCATSYRDWICAVSIPRCSTTESSSYIYRSKTDNRNSYVNKFIKPTEDYYEVLPCIDMCYAIVRDCPSVFNFKCPDQESEPELLFQSYNIFKQSSPFITCNFIGNASYLKIHK